MLPPDPDHTQIYGGGRAKIDDDNKVITLSGESYDFGKYNPEKAKTALSKHKRFKDYEVIIK